MSLENILLMLDEELARLQKVRALLASTGKIASTITHTLPAAKKRRALSAESRRRIAEAQRKRWAALKAEARKPTNRKPGSKA